MAARQTKAEKAKPDTKTQDQQKPDAPGADEKGQQKPGAPRKITRRDVLTMEDATASANDPYRRKPKVSTRKVDGRATLKTRT